MRLSDQVAEEQGRGILLPTPIASTGGPNPGRDTNKGPTLATVADALSSPRLLPTPQANLASQTGSQPPEKRRAGGHSVGLDDAVVHLLPTPSTSNAHGNRTNGRGEELLPGAVDRLLPTPKAQDSAASGGGSASDMTLTDAVVRTDLGQREHPRAERLLPTPKAGDADFHSGATSGRPVEKSTHLGTIALLTDGHLEHRREPEQTDDVRLLPTPSAALHNDGESIEQWQARHDHHATKADAPTRSGKPLPIAVQETGVGPVDDTSDGHTVAWGPYRDAITRTTEVLGRKPPRPTESAKEGGKPKLAAPFVEWMMLLDPGHVTGVPGITRPEALRALGNGVVPAQARAAVSILLGRATERVRARRQDQGAQ